MNQLLIATDSRGKGLTGRPINMPYPWKVDLLIRPGAKINMLGENIVKNFDQEADKTFEVIAGGICDLTTKK